MEIDAQFVGHDLMDVGVLGIGRLREEIVFVAVLDGGFVGDAWPDAEHLSLLGGIEIDIFLYFRPGTHEVHIAAQHIDQLWELIEFVFPDQGAASRDTRVFANGKQAFAVASRAHASELKEPKGLSVFPNPLLEVKGAARRLKGNPKSQ